MSKTIVEDIAFGNTIKRQREQLTRSSKRVADAIGMDFEEYTRKENGFEPFTESEKEKLKTALI